MLGCKDSKSFATAMTPLSKLTRCEQGWQVFAANIKKL